VNDALTGLSAEFEKLYAREGRPSIPPGRMLRALLLQAVIAHPRVKRLLSKEHFPVDGTLIDAWASMKSFRRKDGADDDAGPGRNAERGFRDAKRSNETHASTTDPDARLYRKGKGRESRLYYMGHALMENCSVLAVAGRLTQATGMAEREAALDMPEQHRTGKRRKTAIDGRTTRHPGYAISQIIRKRIEEIFGWAKSSAGMAKTKFKGRKRVAACFMPGLTAYNLIRLPKLLAAPA